MEKWLIAVLVMLILVSPVSAQTVPASEFKITLIDVIRDYLQSQTPKLEKNELKDLIVAYITAPSDTIDLSGNGKFSGKKLIDTYNKFKGITISGCGIGCLEGEVCYNNKCCEPKDCLPNTKHWKHGLGTIEINLLGNTGWFWLHKGQKKTYYIDITYATGPYLRVRAYGGTNEAKAKFTWTFPDGREFPTLQPLGLSTGNSLLWGSEGSSTIVLRTQMNPFGWSNIADQYIPTGRHYMTIEALEESYLMLSILDGHLV